MVLSRVSLLKVFNYHTLLALCALGLIYHFYSLNAASTFGHAAPKDAIVPATPRTGEIPKILWYKLGPRGMTDDTRKWTDSCIQPNPTYRAEFLTDETSDAWVRKTFSPSRPELVESYLALSVPIFKADILRYLLLWDQGGIWSDLDVSCNGIPIDDWVPAEYKDKANLVVGWEFDQGWEGQYVRQFTSWTIMSAPRSPHMLQVIDDIFLDLEKITATNDIAVQNVTLALAGDVVDFSGPRRLTRSIYTSLSNMMNATVGPLDVQEILKPKLVGDVLVMPGKSFAASSNRYTPEQERELPPSLVTHHYAGSWKNDHGGES
ncbi:glycosyltransferase family 32 protein [Plenodomus tracheiphilus IPT5]|uniref:Glycosyltransferase family 32 protein n=1 Tax=Plenodomus tracheiphilus IPT5 TaxID=1408161 RepID=A0A6A7BF68_9PLEO|nr:glycosyltransferase family 32 protein [Plenodomus tracheiphilus IPT5]